MAGKAVLKFADKAAKIKRTSDVTFLTDEGEEIVFKIQSISSDKMGEINAKYEAQKPPVPTKSLPAKNGKRRVIELDQDPTYLRALGEVQRKNFAELALNFLIEEERPEGAVDEQVEQMMGVELAGFVSKIMTTGLDISGFNNDDDEEEEFAEEKND